MNGNDRYQGISPIASEALARYVAQIDVKPVYNKTLPPPEGEPFLETQTGLKYWLMKYGSKLGCQSAVLTEDASISMHYYGGGRERGGTYLFRYRGFQIGFLFHELNGRPFPQLDVFPDRDRERGISIWTVTGIGTPVFDEEAILARNWHGEILYYKTGELKYDLSASRTKGFVTGLSWQDRISGKSDKFESREQQDEMLLIWADLFTGLRSRLVAFLHSDWRGLPSAMQFTDDIQKQIENGDLIR
ncbi:hypothetical protein [Pelagibacterium halotolerans]|uniref:hypothetical protein n=1 Tax=Pelagibacterium halotolerans TaxID=531813 RepID=UPI0038505E71